MASVNYADDAARKQVLRCILDLDFAIEELGIVPQPFGITDEGETDKPGVRMIALKCQGRVARKAIAWPTEKRASAIWVQREATRLAKAWAEGS